MRQSRRLTLTPTSTLYRSTLRTRRSPRRARSVLLMLVAVLTLAVTGCGRGRATPTPTPTPTPVPTPTATPTPSDTTNAPSTGETTGAQPTPVVVIPEGFTVRTDARLGYSVALPRGWTDIDLRSPRFTGMVESIGMGEQLAPLLSFLETPQGQAIGLVAATDLAGMVFGGLPTVANVAVVDAPGATQADMIGLVDQLLAGNRALLGNVSIDAPAALTVNNLPAVQATAAGSLAAAGLDAQLFAKVTALLTNDRVYVLTLVTDAGKRADNEPEFDRIIGTFRPE